MIRVSRRNAPEFMGNVCVTVYGGDDVVRCDGGVLVPVRDVVPYGEMARSAVDDLRNAVPFSDEINAVVRFYCTYRSPRSLDDDIADVGEAYALDGRMAGAADMLGWRMASIRLSADRGLRLARCGHRMTIGLNYKCPKCGLTHYNSIESGYPVDFSCHVEDASTILDSVFPCTRCSDEDGVDVERG